MLCPPIEETGNPVQCYPVPGYPLDIVASWEPTQEGEGDPSPDNIRPIKGRDNVVVQRCGQNLVNLPVNNTINGVTITTESDGRYRLQGQKISGNFTMPIGLFSLPPGTYSIMGSELISSGKRGICISLRKMTDTGSELWFDTYLNTAHTETLEQETRISVNFWGYASDIPDGETIDGYIELMLVAGAEPPTEYVPYTGQITTLTLPEAVYSGSVDVASGEGKKTWGSIILDGTENWYEYNNNTYNGYAAALLKGNYPYNTERKCTHYKEADYWVGADNTMVYFLKVANEADKNTISAWKQYLATQYAAETPVQIVYKLAASIIFQANGEDVVPAVAGINTVLSDADSLVVRAREDLLHVLSSIQASE